MNKAFRRAIYIILAIGAVFIIGTVSVNFYLKNKLETFIQDRLPENMIRAYDKLSVESFGGSLTLTNASLIIKNKQDSLRHTFINVEKLTISDIHYWDYIVNNQIHIDEISLENPKIAYYKDRIKQSTDSVRKPVFRIYKPIIINDLKVNNTTFVIYEKGADSTKIYTKGLSLEIKDIRVDNKTITQRLPLDFGSYEAKSDSVFLKVSAYDNLTTEGFTIKNRKAIFKNLRLKTKYSKTELSKIISKERDHYNLEVNELSIADIDFGFKQNVFFGKSKKITLASPSLEIFRDKLVADDPTIKPLYSKSLRELPFQLTVDSLKITDAKIKYQERVKAENMGGAINFEHLNAAITNVSNTYQAPEKTEIKIQANFMKNTPIVIDWSFDVQNKSDQFLFKGEVGPLVADKMNTFTEPNLKVRLNGHTNKTYFTIDGNNDTSKTDMKISYSDFKVTVLQKNGTKKNKFLSAIANIFISKDSEKNNENYREGSAEATRDKTKSIFNFLWISVKSALIKSMTGKNKKE